MSTPLEQELQESVNCPTSVLGTEQRAVLITEPSLQPNLDQFSMSFEIRYSKYSITDS